MSEPALKLVEAVEGTTEEVFHICWVCNHHIKKKTDGVTCGKRACKERLPKQLLEHLAEKDRISHSHAALERHEHRLEARDEALGVALDEISNRGLTVMEVLPKVLNTEELKNLPEVKQALELLHALEDEIHAQEHLLSK